jgi:glycosyltransferase involved in cell wall biosynthesis
LRHNRDNIDLLVINTMFNPPNIAVGRAARKGGIPYLVSPHDPYHPELLGKNKFRKSVYAALFERPLLTRAAAVQVLSGDHTQWLDRWGAKTALVIPNGFSLEDSDNVKQPADEGAIALQGNPRLLCLGRMDVHHKGLDLLIRGFGRALRSGLLPERPEISFVGRGTRDVEALQRLASTEGVAEHVHFLGEVSDRTRRAALHDCDMLLLCSRYDGFGLVALEAMLAAKPVFVSRQAGISTWVEKARAGFIAEPTVSGICDGLTECVGRRGEWNTLGKNGRSYAHRHLSWDQVANHAAYCYQELLSELPVMRPDKGHIRVIGIREWETSELGRMNSTCL